MARLRLWLMWSWRDLRARWVQVAVIAMIIALGTGSFAGLGSTKEWRKASNDASYDLLNMHDLRVRLSEGSYADEGSLARAVDDLGSGSGIVKTEERLILPTQVDASHDGETILVPGRVVGVDTSDGGPHIDGLHATGGKTLSSSGRGNRTGVLESHFATHYDLPATGRVTLAGGVTIDYVGTALSPEYFMVTTDEGGLMAEANFAVVFVPLTTAQEWGGIGPRVNDLLIDAAPGTDIGALSDSIRTTLREDFPELGVTVDRRRDDSTYRMLYDDIEGDQKFWNTFAMLILLGAAFAAFNLTGRIVEGQRREIGIAMALGVPRLKIAARFLLMGAEIAALGVLFGLGVGYIITLGLRSIFASIFPLPIWETPFQPRVFITGALLGFAIPFVATSWPVVRAVRVEPINAIRTGHVAVRLGVIGRAMSRIGTRRGAAVAHSLRAVLRAPRRTVLTALGIGASIVALVGILGMLDSFNSSIDDGERFMLRGTPDRLSVRLMGFQPVESETVTAIAAIPGVERSEPAVLVGGRLMGEDGDLDVQLELIDFQGMWSPGVGLPDESDRPQIVIARKAAADLGLAVGDVVPVEHPLRTGPLTMGTTVTEMAIAATHDYPMRSNAYMDLREAGVMGLTGLTDLVNVDPADDASIGNIKRALLGIPGVSSATEVAAAAETFRDLVGQFMDVLAFLVLFMVALVVLIAFNSASINFDERRREHATMFAFGSPPRRAVGGAMIEAAMVGALGTFVGLLAGVAVVGYFVTGVAAETMPDIELSVSLSRDTIAIAVITGTVCVALAPLLNWRRLRRMDIPGTLRVME